MCKEIETTEVWKLIEGFPNYMVSNLGRVKSLNFKRTGKEGIMKPGISNWGYPIVVLSRDREGL